MDQASGGEILRRSLLHEGVEVMFGYPGGAILPFYDALHGQDAPRHVLVRHEQFAAFAADGYARATGRVGVCVATSGPGASNLVTGLGTALMDSVPMVAITGQVPSAALGTDAFQELDVVGMTMPVTKHAFLVQHVKDIPAVVAEAFRIARSGRPGPTLVDVPKDILLAVAETALPAHSRRGQWTHARANGANGRGGGEDAGAAGAHPRAEGTADLGADLAASVDRARALLREARRPIIMAGRGAVLAGVTDLLLRFAEAHDLPVVTTLLGLDAFPSDHPLCLGMPGMHGTERANLAIQRTDLVLGLGLRFDDRVTGRVSGFAPHAQIVHFEVSDAITGRTVRPHVRVRGDLARTLPALARGAGARPLEGWWAELRGWCREAEEVDEALAEAGPLSGRIASRMLGRWIGDRGAIVATDVGQHQMWLAQELRNARPGSHITSGGLGSMGYALPAAIGAAVACPDRETWVVAGDGGFQMSAPELATVVQERLPIRIAVVNNAALGLVWQWQSLTYGQRFVASHLSGPNLEMLARAHGVPAWTVTTVAGLDEALRAASAAAGPSLLDIQVPNDEHVFPMVQPGAALDQMTRGRERALR